MKQLLATVALLTVAVPSSAMPLEEIAEMTAIMSRYECAILSTGYAKSMAEMQSMRAEMLPKDTLQSWNNFLDLYGAKGKESPQYKFYLTLSSRFMRRDEKCRRAFMALPD